MKQILLLLILAFGLLKCEAQYFNQTTPYIKGNSVWVFGKKAGYNLNTQTAFTTPIQSEEGCASVANRTTGELLFSSDGRSVWNRNQGVMTQANGNLLGNNMNNGTTAQGVCIVPFINDPNKYYLFSMQPQGGYALTASRGRLYYSVVDMTLSNGMGNVVTTQRNILIDSLLSEAMIAIPGNNCDIWLMVHKVDTALFVAYHITAAGIDPNPVYSTTGSELSGVNTFVMNFGGQPFNYYYGAYMVSNMAVSPDRSKLSITSHVSSLGTLSVYNGLVNGSMVCDFNPTSGVVSSAIILDTIGCYGTAFSPDNSKLYITTTTSPINSYDLVQYDISNYTANAIIASRNIVHQGFNGSYGLKSYHDTLYVAYGGSSSNTPNIHRVNKPNLTGVAADFQSNAITLAANTTCNFMLSNNVVYPYPPDTASITMLDTSLCEASWSTITLTAAAGYQNYIWDDGSVNPDRIVTQSGTYWVLCKDACHSKIDSFFIRALPPDTTGAVALDTLICSSFDPFTLTAASGYSAYIWNDGTTTNTKSIQAWGTYWVLGKDSCNPHVDTFHVRGADMKFDLGNDTNLCEHGDFQLIIDIDSANYLWQDGSNGTTYTVSTSGTYGVVVNKNGCIAADDIRINYIDLRQSLGNDTTFCLGSPFSLDLKARVPTGSTALWNTGATGDVIDVKDTGTYFVTVKQEQCIGSDTLHIDYIICECAYLMPTAFTPNNDGVNDLYNVVIQSGCATSRYSLNIYNRFGQRVFSGSDPKHGWDGTFNSKYCDVGTYFYELNFEGGSRKIQYNQKGDLTLIR